MDLLDKDGLTEREFLEQYRIGDYERPSVAADMVIFTVTDAEVDSYRKLPEKELRVLRQYPSERLVLRCREERRKGR